MRRLHSDRGAALVLIAGSLISLIAFAGLVLDGGNAYSQRRQMQNAADASALAGANALQGYRENPAIGSRAIYDAALAAATANEASSATFECDLVRFNPGGVEVGTSPCPQVNGAPITPDTYKVRVRLDGDYDTRFISVVGPDSFTARGTAAAWLRAATLTAGPFMLCGPQTTATGLEVPLVERVAGEWEWNPAAVGQIYNLWGNQINEPDQAGRCGIRDGSFRGLVDVGEEYPVPGWWGVDPGNQGGVSPPSVVEGCGPDIDHIRAIPDDCEMALPVCVMGNGETGTRLELYCVKIGRFITTPSPDPNDIEGRFLGGGVATTGGGGGFPGPLDTVVVKLIE